MKIGLSLSRCARDIYDCTVDFDDVLIVIARTNFDPQDDEEWSSIWQGYHHGGAWVHSEWVDIDDEQALRDVCIALKVTGKLHQPRQFGAYPPRLPYHWLDTFAPEEEIANNPAVKEAWENYKLLAKLSS